MALLPKNSEENLPKELSDAAIARLNRQILWLVRDSEKDSAAPAEWWFSELKKIPELAIVEGKVSASEQAKWGEFFFKNRAQILDKKTRQTLTQSPETWARWVMAQLYSPFAGVSANELQRDPLLLVRAHQLSLQNSATSAFTLEKNWPSASEDSGRKWRFLNGELRNSSYDIAQSHALVEKLTAMEQELKRRWPDSSVLQRGAIFYSDYATSQSKADIAFLGTLSTIGVVLLIILFFRSPLPFFMTLLTSGIGMLTGVTALVLCFEKVHLLALVLSTSVIGIAVDYALHFLTEKMTAPPEETGFDALRRIIQPLVFCFLTTVFAYLIFFIAPFPGFRQLTIYAIFGLTGAFLTVVLWFPFLSKKLPHRIPQGRGVLEIWTRRWRDSKSIRFGIPAIALIFGISGLFFLKANDDVAALQSFPSAFQENEKAIEKLTGQRSDMNWFVVQSDTAENLLQQMEKLAPVLAKLKEEKAFSDARLVSDSLPSIAMQRKNYETAKTATSAVCRELINSEIAIENFEIPPFSPVLPQEWINSPVSRGLRLFWFEQKDGNVSALIPVSGITNNALMRSVASEFSGVHWLNRRAQLSELFSVYRKYVEKLLAIAIAVIAIVFVFRFGIFHGLKTTLPVFVAVLVALGTLAFTGQTLNLFSLLALVLVLGIGIDYSLFFANKNAIPATTMLAVFVDALTTLIGFGMLAFSGSPVISGFGVVLAAGIFTAFLLAPLAQNAKEYAQD